MFDREIDRALMGKEQHLDDVHSAIELNKEITMKKKKKISKLKK